MRIHGRRIYLATAAMMLAGGGFLYPQQKGEPAAGTIRETAISGYLETDSGEPLEGNFAFLLRFYGDSTAEGKPLSELTVTAQIERGTFSLPVPIGPELLAEEKLFYTMAVDVDNDGMDDSDRFPDVFQMAHAPFAMQAEGLRPGALKAFSTHSVAGDLEEYTSFPAGSTSEGFPIPLGEFLSPPSGIKYNLLTASLRTSPGTGTDPNASCSFGIYDRDGRRVAYSGSLSFKLFIALDPLASNGAPHLLRFQTVVPDGTLEPSQRYYTAWTSNRNTGYVLRTREANMHLTDDVFPWARGAVPNAGLPDSIATISQKRQSLPIPLTLSWNDEATSQPAGAIRILDEFKVLVDFTMDLETIYQ